MVLEATVVILDNSEWMRNGDFIPSRFDVQQDAAHLICNAKCQSNVENVVSIMTMGGSSPKVLVTLTSEQSKLQHALASSRLEGHSSCNLTSALQIGQLILKNRQNSNQRQRIIVFLGSPLVGVSSDVELAALSSVGRLIRKNGVSLDIISFGCVQENSLAITSVLVAAGGLDPTTTAAQNNIHEALLGAGCECHLLVVNSGESLTDSLMSSPILLGDDGSNVLGNFGMDEDMDPELAMALKMSLEEEQVRLQKEKVVVVSSSVDSNPTTKLSSNAAPLKMTENETNSMAIDDEDDEETMMAQAIAMSLETASKESKDQGDSNTINHQKEE